MKAILVIEHLPEQTDIKNLLVSYRVFDRANKNHEVMKGAKGLRPMPMKEDEIDDSGHDTDQAYVIGWNACLEELEK